MQTYTHTNAHTLRPQYNRGKDFPADPFGVWCEAGSVWWAQNADRKRA